MGLAESYRTPPERIMEPDMLSIHTIERNFQQQRFEGLLEAVLANGLRLPLPLHIRLSQSPAAGVAMGLRRLVELTYGPTALSRRMTQWLLERQLDDGSFDADPLATAVVAAALSRVLANHFADGDGARAGAVPAASAGGPRINPAASAGSGAINRVHGDDPTSVTCLAEASAGCVAAAHERALSALAGLQREDGLFAHENDRTDDDRALVAALIVFLLAEDEAFRASVRFADLLSWVEEHHATLSTGSDELWQMAQIAAMARPGATAPGMGRPATARDDRPRRGSLTSTRQVSPLRHARGANAAARRTRAAAPPAHQSAAPRQRRRSTPGVSGSSGLSGNGRSENKGGDARANASAGGTANAGAGGGGAEALEAIAA